MVPVRYLTPALIAVAVDEPGLGPFLEPGADELRHLYVQRFAPIQTVGEIMQA